MERVPTNHRLAERALISLVHDGQLEIDDQGRIWRVAMRHGLKMGGSHVVPVERRRAEKAIPRGYLMIRAVLGATRVCGLAHRLVWQHLRGDIPPGLCINHRNGDKQDNRPENLELATYSENLKHAHRIGLVNQRGLRNPIGKLTDEDVATIRARRARGERLLAIARDFGVTYQHVSAIARHKVGR